VLLVVILVRSRHSFSDRPFHSGICVYIACFVPYSLLKAIAVYRLLNAQTENEILSANWMLNTTFMIFFSLGFGGKMALVQVWLHLMSCHINPRESLMESARRTWKFMRLTVLVACVIYGSGFFSIFALFSQATAVCASAADSLSCIPLSYRDTTPPECKRVEDLARISWYYEGVFAGVVAVVFSLYALMFDGLARALLSNDSTFSKLPKLQRILISNKVLRWMLKPFVRAHVLCCKAANFLNPPGSFRHRVIHSHTKQHPAESSAASPCAS
jgi:hypothetical protein